MGKHRARKTDHKLAGGIVLGATVSSAFAVATLNGTGQADATCASISGVSAGEGCTSTATSFAVGIGSGTTASAQGLFTGAIAAGTNASAVADGNFSLAAAVGEEASASAVGGNNNIAIAIGDPADVPDPGDPTVTFAAAALSRQPTRAIAGRQLFFITRAAAPAVAAPSNNNNISISVGNGAFSQATDGSSNSAVAVGLRATAIARGGAQRAVAIGPDARDTRIRETGGDPRA